MVRRLLLPAVLTGLFVACASEVLPPAAPGGGGSGHGGSGQGGSGGSGQGGTGGSGGVAQGGSGGVAQGGSGGVAQGGSGGVAQGGSGGNVVADPCDDATDPCNGGVCERRVVDCGAVADRWLAFCAAGTCYTTGAPGECVFTREQILEQCADGSRVSPSNDAQWFCASTVDACPNTEAYGTCIDAECGP